MTAPATTVVPYPNDARGQSVLLDYLARLTTAKTVFVICVLRP